MSIYPKKISNGENLIIHLRFSNKGRITKKIKYVLSILNPDNVEILKKENSIILGTEKNEFIKQLYYSLSINDQFMPGKYIVKFYIIYKDHIIESSTKDNDYFFVEKLEYYTSKNKTFIYNNSEIETNFKLYKNNIKKEFLIKGKTNLQLNDRYEYIEYANNKLDKINKK